MMKGEEEEVEGKLGTDWRYRETSWGEKKNLVINLLSSPPHPLGEINEQFLGVPQPVKSLSWSS